MFADSPSTIMEVAFGRLHNGGPANIAKTYYGTMEICIKYLLIRISCKFPNTDKAN